MITYQKTPMNGYDIMRGEEKVCTLPQKIKVTPNLYSNAWGTFYVTPEFLDCRLGLNLEKYKERNIRIILDMRLEPDVEAKLAKLL